MYKEKQMTKYIRFLINSPQETQMKVKRSTTLHTVYNA
jgi:hypothetical protein